MELIIEELKLTCIHTLKENHNKIKASLEKLSDEAVWWRPNQQSNSMGNIILHLCGNITQYILCGLGGAEDHRTRSKEFEEQGPINIQDLLIQLDQTLEKVYAIIHQCNETDLLNKKQIQIYHISGVNILVHVTEHFSYHTGQIVYYTKMKSGESLNFYDDKKMDRKR